MLPRQALGDEEPPPRLVRSPEGVAAEDRPRAVASGADEPEGFAAMRRMPPEHYAARCVGLRHRAGAKVSPWPPMVLEMRPRPRRARARPNRDGLGRSRRRRCPGPAGAQARLPWKTVSFAGSCAGAKDRQNDGDDDSPRLRFFLDFYSLL